MEIVYPILRHYKNSAEPIIFAEYDKSGKIKHVLRVCYICVLVIYLLFFILAISCDWVKDEVRLYCFCILVWLVALTFP